MKLQDESGVEATRRVIDVSGDGPNNQGRMVIQARDDAVAKGITINGLPIMLRKPGYLDIPELDVYYKDCVIGGQGAFTVPVRERDQFIEAIKTKIFSRSPASRLPPLITHSGRPAQQLPVRRNAVAGSLEQLTRPIMTQLTLALVAHDAKKDDMARFVAMHEEALRPFALFATGTTGGRVMERCPSLRSRA